MIGQLAENYPGSVYDQIPKGVFNFGRAGVNGWRTLCGVPLGGSAILKQIEAPQSVMDEFMAWYERTPFPTNDAAEDFQSGTWSITDVSKQPKDNAPMSVPKSILCHASVGRWVEAAGGSDGAWATVNFGGNITTATSDRCGKVTYDCTKKLCELINDWMAGTLPSGALDASVDTCLTSGCHSGTYDVAIADCAPEVNGKMKCDESCHQ